MKKTLVTLMIVALSLFMVSCGSCGGTTEAVQEAVVETEAVVEEAVVEVADTVEAVVEETVVEVVVK